MVEQQLQEDMATTSWYSYRVLCRLNFNASVLLFDRPTIHENVQSRRLAQIIGKPFGKKC